MHSDDKNLLAQVEQMVGVIHMPNAMNMEMPL
jgi:hypothetical protein